MKRLWLAACAVVFISCVSSVCWCEEPQKVTVCQLQGDPPAYNHKLVEVEAFVSHDFEDFTLFDPACNASWGAVWLEYGGKSKSDTTYCCGPTAGKSRPRELQVENIPIPLAENDLFRLFDKQIQPPFRSGKYGSVVHATIVGRFFAGRKKTYPNGESTWAGYGHMGCCSLLAIQEIESVDPQDRDDLDYGASHDQLDVEKVGCGPQELLPSEPGTSLIHDQQLADHGERAWAFDDPQRVASDGLIGLAKLKVPGPLALKETRRAPGRIVYEWREAANAFPMMVVVSRPYVLSFYAHDPKRVAWGVVAAYKLWCESDDPASHAK
jgi:hypothetical protein